jgi:4'-phosphopantetheinyl transferase EntD
MCSAPLDRPAPPGPLARLLADARIKVAELDPRSVPAGVGLFPEELASVSKAVESRRQQFTAGRVLARRAWAELGLPATALLSDEQRVPRWPSGIVGTITHTHGWCAAAVAPANEISALGADVEAATPLELGLWERICRPEERHWLDRQTQAGVLAKAVFSAKESIYKALYPNARRFLDFQAMRLELQLDATGSGGTWHATLQIPWGPFQPGQRFDGGKLSIDRDWILTAIAIPTLG